MQHPNRDILEANFATKLKALSASLKRELAGYVGNPPNFNNVPADFWTRAEEEYSSEIIAALYLIHLENQLWHAEEAGASLHGIESGFDAAATAYANGSGATTAAGAMRTARDRWLAKSGELQSRQAGPNDLIGGTGAPITRAEIKAIIDETFPESQADNIAKTETTAAQTAGGDAGMDQTVGTSPLDKWSTRPELSRSGPCPNCAALDGEMRQHWGIVALPGEGHDGNPDDGPPLGPGCCCEIIYSNVPLAKH